MQFPHPTWYISPNLHLLVLFTVHLLLFSVCLLLYLFVQLLESNRLSFHFALIHFLLCSDLFYSTLLYSSLFYSPLFILIHSIIYTLSSSAFFLILFFTRTIHNFNCCQILRVHTCTYMYSQLLHNIPLTDPGSLRSHIYTEGEVAASLSGELDVISGELKLFPSFSAILLNSIT